MYRFVWIFSIVCLGVSCTSERMTLSTSLQVTVEPIVDLTPPNSTFERVPLSGLTDRIHEVLARKTKAQEPVSRCGVRYAVVISPSVAYGYAYPDSTDQKLGTSTLGLKPDYRSEWSSLIGMRDEANSLQSHLELSRSNASKPEAPVGLDIHLSEGLTVFLKELQSTFEAFDVSISKLPEFYSKATVQQKKLLLERLSLCPSPEHDTWLGQALQTTKDVGLKFRLVGLIGERRVDALGDLLIDMVDLNDIEWTRALVRTLSILKHHRARELFGILSVHESPLLQKELKTAVERLERRQKIP